MAAERRDDVPWERRPIEQGRLRGELVHLKRRARRRIGVVVALATAMTALVLGVVARRQPMQESRVVIRVTENDVLEEYSPLISGDLRNYLLDSALSDRNMLALIERFELYPVHRARGERFAIDRLRSRLELEVFRNYFVKAARGMTTERTARIALTFVDPDPVVSFQVARAMAELIIETENARRAAYSADDLRIAELAVSTAATSVREREQAIAALQVALSGAKARGDTAAVGALTVELDTARSQLEALGLTLGKAREKLDQLELLHTLNTAQLGLQFAVAAEHPPPARGSLVQKLVMVGLVAFLVLIPACALGLGAFDGRLHDREDLERLGLPVVGHLPRFAGQRIGSLDERRGRKRRLSGDVEL